MTGFFFFLSSCVYDPVKDFTTCYLLPWKPLPLACDPCRGYHSNVLVHGAQLPHFQTSPETSGDFGYISQNNPYVTITVRCKLQVRKSFYISWGTCCRPDSQLLALAQLLYVSAARSHWGDDSASKCFFIYFPAVSRYPLATTASGVVTNRERIASRAIKISCFSTAGILHQDPKPFEGTLGHELQITG